MLPLLTECVIITLQQVLRSRRECHHLHPLQQVLQNGWVSVPPVQWEIRSEFAGRTTSIIFIINLRIQTGSTLSTKNIVKALLQHFILFKLIITNKLRKRELLLPDCFHCVIVIQAEQLWAANSEES